MRRLLSTLAALALTATSAFAQAAPLFSATYEGEYGSLNIEMVRELHAKGANQFELHSKAKSFMASIEESSQFSQQGAEFIPSQYHYKRKIFGVKKEEALQFDWQAKKATYLKNRDQEGVTQLTDGMLDPSLYQLQLQTALANNPAQEEFTVSFARRSQVKSYAFKQIGKSPITVQGKTYQAIELKRANDGDKETQLWFIPELDYTLAKIQHTEDGEQHSMTLTGYQSSAEITQFMKSASNSAAAN